MDNFSSQFTEARNRSRLDDLMLGKGFVPYHLALDTGVDVIYYHEAADKILKVQLKSRATMDKKYIGRGLCLIYPFKSVNDYESKTKEMEIWKK